jgi:hypothetical protein
MRKTIVSTGDKNVPTVYPGWGDVGPVTALGKAEKELESTQWELLLVRETLKKSRDLITELQAEIELLKGHIIAGA